MRTWWRSFKNTIRPYFQKLRNPFPNLKLEGFPKWLFRFAKIFFFLILIFIAYVFAVGNNLFWLFGKSPSLDELERPQANQATEIYTADSVLMGKYYIENRVPVSYNKISPSVVHALLSTEDIRFYKHSGIDILAMPSILWYAIKGENRGGSTITQQLAKNLYKIRSDDYTGFLGKIPGFGILISKTKEWITAAKLERRFTKEEIITMYLNTVDFGSNTFGIKTAAKTFFHVSPDSLKIQDAALLIGLLKAPTYYSPILNPKNSIRRRNTVLSQMKKYGYLKPELYAELIKEPLGLNYSVEKYYDGPGTYLRGTLTSYLKAWCAKNGYDLYTDGLKIYTTINSTMQMYAEEAVETNMRTQQKRFFEHWKGQNPWIDSRKNEIPHFIEDAAKYTHIYQYLKKKYHNDSASIFKEMNKPKAMTVFSWKGERDTVLSSMDSIRYYKHFLHAGFMVMDPFNGQIKAWVGGINYKYFQYDHVMQARRQPGSTFKPILYATAFENGYGPCDSMVDMPVTIRYEENGEQKSWSPHNADYEFTNTRMTLRRAMAKSVNSIAAQLTEKVGWDKVKTYAQKLGIKSPLAAVPSIGLGSSDVTVYELAGAYSTFLNHGIWTEPAFLTKICDRHGNVLATFVSQRKRALSEETAYLMVDMLKAGLEEPGGTSQALFSFDLFRGNQLGGKTGTSSNHSDGWFVGVSKELVGAAWVGGEDRAIHFRTSNLGEGSKTALPIFGLFMEKVYKDKSLGITMGYFPKPSIKINKPYNCRTYLPKPDTLATDSILIPKDTIP